MASVSGAYVPPYLPRRARRAQTFICWLSFHIIVAFTRSWTPSMSTSINWPIWPTRFLLNEPWIGEVSSLAVSVWSKTRAAWP